MPEEECPPPGLPMWMATYSDLVTLLLTFFVLLLTMATMDPIKFVQAKSSIKAAFGWRTTAAPVPFSIPVLPSPPKAKFSPIPRESMIPQFKRIQQDVELAKLQATVETIYKDNDSIILRINDSVLFDKGATKLNPAAYPILRKVADILRPLPMNIRIEGHTDNVPLTSDGRTNWDLSVDRAVSVMGFLHRGTLLSLDRLAASGYGDTRPVAPNNSTENMAKNRRVDFVLRSNRRVTIGGMKSSPLPF